MQNELIKRNIPDVPILASKQERPLGPGVASSLHYHDEIEFIVVYEGKMSCSVYGKEYEAGPGEVIFINSRVPHSTCRVTKNYIGLIQLREDDFTKSDDGVLKYSRSINTSLKTPIKVFSGGELFAVADELLRESTERDKGYAAIVRSCVFKLLGLLYRDGALADTESFVKTKEREKILPLLSYINGNCEKELSLAGASEMLGFDRSYFCRIFKAATGATFTEYLNFVRVSRAEALLSEGNLNILEISEAVGFSSVSYFTRTFKRYKGCSPGVYRTAKYSVE